MFKNTIAISKLTLFIGPYFFFSRGEIDTFYFLDDIFGFLAVSTDISYRCRSDESRDKDHIFSACEFFFYGSHHGLMPVLSCSDIDDHRKALLSEYGFTFQGYFDDESRIVLRKKDIRASSEN